MWHGCFAVCRHGWLDRLLWEASPEAMQRADEWHDATERELITARKDVVYEVIDDVIQAVLPTALEAVTPARSH